MTGDGKANIELVKEKKGAVLGITKLQVGSDVVLTGDMTLILSTRIFMNVRDMQSGCV